MIVISDATPIISLIKIECLDILEELYKNMLTYVTYARQV